jgi:hypothetical protein
MVNDELIMTPTMQSIQNKLALQQQNLIDQENQIQQMLQPQQEQQVDISPLLALSDAWTGSRLASSYKRPETDQERSMKAAYLKQGLNKQKRDTLSDEIKLLQILEKQSEKDKKEAEKDKPKDLSQTMIKKINEGNAIPSMLSNVNSLIDENQDKFGPLAGRIASNNPYDTRAQGIEAEIRAKSQSFGRFMEGGVLRAEDEKKYRKMFPNLSDTPEVAKKKLEVVQDLLNKKQQSDIEAFKAQGYDTKGLDMPMTEKSKPKDKYDEMSDEELLQLYNRQMGNK